MSIILTFTVSQELTSYTFGGQIYLTTNSPINTIFSSVNDNITTIASQAFLSLSELKQVFLPSTITTIGSFAFYNCTSLDTINLANTLITAINQGVFTNTGFTSIDIPARITNVQGLSDCVNLTTVNFYVTGTSPYNPSLTYVGVININNFAFQNCVNLTTINTYLNGTLVSGTNIFPYSLTLIDNAAFFNCNLKPSITIPKSTTNIYYASISSSVFGINKNLESIMVDPLNPNYTNNLGDGVLYTKNLDVLIQYPLNKPGTTFIVPSATTIINSYAFSVIQNLTTINLSNVRSLYNNAFLGSKTFTSFTIPTTLTSIGNQAFVGCYNVTNFTVTEPNNSYSSLNGVLYNNGRRTLINYPSGNSRTTFTVPTSVRTVDQSSFVIGADYIPANIKLNTVIFQNVAASTTLNTKAFFQARSLTTVILTNNIISMGPSCFDSCVNLVTINIPTNPSLITLERELFNNCVKLNSITTIPSNITTISNRAFYNTGITTISIPSSVTSIVTTVFTHCNNLTSFTVSSSNPNYSSSNGVLYNKNGTILINYPIGNTATSFEIPSAVTTLEISAFQGSPYLTSITFPSNSAITTIKGEALDTSIYSPPPDYYGAFSDCTALLNMTIPSTVTQLGNVGNSVGYVFANSTSLEYVLFGDNIQITKIGSYMFNGCTNITLVPMPSKVTSLGENSFYDCTSLKIFYYSISGITTIGNDAFGGTNTLEKIFIPNKTGTSVTNLNTPGNEILATSNSFFTLEKNRLTDIVGLTIENSRLYNLLTPPLPCPCISSSKSFMSLNNNFTSDNNDFTSKSKNLKGSTSISILIQLTFNTPQTSTIFIPGYTFVCFNPGVNTIFYVLDTGSNTLIVPNDAFRDNENLTGVVFSSNVKRSNNTYPITSIGNYAFAHCTGIIPPGLQNGTGGLTSVTIPTGVTLGNYVFDNCVNLFTVTFSSTNPQTTWTIGTNIFNECGLLYDQGASGGVILIPQAYTLDTIPPIIVPSKYVLQNNIIIKNTLPLNKYFNFAGTIWNNY